MNRSLHDAAALRRRRDLLQNPYAHIEHLEEVCAALKDDHAVEAKQRSLTAEGLRRRPVLKIDQLVGAIHRRLWQSRFKLWQSSEMPSTPIGFLSPEKAAGLLGMKMFRVEALGTFDDKLNGIAVAGLLDRNAREIRISADMPLAVQRFTAAHEIGHVLLHPHMSVLHRDRALDGTYLSRDSIENEADTFAVRFLMPEKLVRKEFEGRFLTSEFVLDEQTTFALGVKLKGCPDRRSLSRVLASAVQYNGRFFASLADYFGLSVEAVAIRLEELNIN